jgi:predicted metal-dependent hydrolase
MVDWPPSYTIKKHNMARSVKLKVSRARGLEITIPPRYNVKYIPAVLEEHKTWIIKHLLPLVTQEPILLPDSITLGALNQTWAVRYISCEKKLEMVHSPQQEMTLVGRTNDIDACKLTLINWIKKQAKTTLPALLHQLGVEMQLAFRGITIRDQQTVWGSCTADKAINLNYKLMFLPDYLVNHVLIHELCHLKHLNHSKRFWDLVAYYDTAWRENRRELREADKFIPLWVK